MKFERINETRKILREHSTQLLVGSVFGAIGLLLIFCWPDTTKPLTKFAIGVISFILFTLLGVIAAEIVTLVGQRGVLDNLDQSLDLIREENALLSGASKPVHSVLVRFSSRFWSDVTTHALWVPVRDYLWLLEESLEIATRSIFATSLISPTKWLLETSYKDYMEKQILRKRQHPDLNIRRIFIMDKNSFYNDDSSEELISKHLIGGIQIGWCDQLLLRENDRIDCVMFEANGDKWVVEGGSLSPDIEASNPKDLVSMQFHFAPYAISKWFTHLMKDVEMHVRYFHSIEDFEKMKDDQH